MTDEQIKQSYYQSQGFNCVDVGSNSLRIKEINRQLKNKGYSKIKGSKTKRQLVGMLRGI